MVENLVQIELAYINTKHPDFHEANLIQRALNNGDISERTFDNKQHAPSTGQGTSQGVNNMKPSMSNLSINSNGKLLFVYFLTKFRYYLSLVLSIYVFYRPFNSFLQSSLYNLQNVLLPNLP